MQHHKWPSTQISHKPVVLRYIVNGFGLFWLVLSVVVGGFGWFSQVCKFVSSGVSLVNSSVESLLFNYWFESA